MNLTKMLAVFTFSVLLTACAGSQDVNIVESELGGISGLSTIYVSRFSGDPTYIDISTDLFISGLESQISNTIIRGSTQSHEPSAARPGSGLAQLASALESAEKYEADFLITGEVTHEYKTLTFNGFSTVEVYSVQTGSLVAKFHRGSGLLFAAGMHQCITAAVGRTIRDVSGLFKYK